MSEESRHNAVSGQDATYDHVVKYIGLFGGVQGLNMLINIVRNKITASILGPSGIGLINIYNKVSGLISQATNLGLSFSAVKHVAELSGTADAKQRDRLIDTVRMWCLVTALVGLLVGLVLSPWLSWWTFRTHDYTHTFLLLSLIVAMMAITGGEMAILKGLKQLKKVALISIFAAIATLLVCVPFYYIMGMKGIVSALIVSNAVVLGIHLYYSSKVAPWRRTIVSFSSIQAGSPMVKLGIAYVFAGICGQGGDYIIMAFIQNHGSLESVGLYNTGYFLAVGIGSMLFGAVEADFFPRLSALVNDVKRANKTINRQIEVCVQFVTPCLILEVLAMPLIVRMLYTEEFSQAASMAVCAIFFLFIRSFVLPVAYLPLAKGDSRTYLLTEILYDAFVAVAIPIAFVRYGLVGAGCALSLAALFEFLFIYVYYGVKYQFVWSMHLVWNYLFHFLLLGMCVAVTLLVSNALIRWGVGLFALIASASLSYRVLSREVGVAGSIVEWVRHKLLKK